MFPGMSKYEHHPSIQIVLSICNNNKTILRTVMSERGHVGQYPTSLVGKWSQNRFCKWLAGCSLASPNRNIIQVFKQSILFAVATKPSSLITVIISGKISNIFFPIHLLLVVPFEVWPSFGHALQHKSLYSHRLYWLTKHTFYYTFYYTCTATLLLLATVSIVLY